MKRLYATIALLLGILSLSLFALFQCRYYCTQTAEQVSQIIQYAENGRLDQAAILAEQLSESWSKTKNSMVWYIRYEPLERISDITSRLEFLAKYNDLPQLMAQANQLLTCVHELYDNELPLLRNLV